MSLPMPSPISEGEMERLAQCSREPIRQPGSIQPHGVLIAIDRTSWTIVQASTNAEIILGISAADLLGTASIHLLGADGLASITAVLAESRGASNPVRVDFNVHQFDAIAHETDGMVVVELEPVLPDDGLPSVPAVYAATARLSTATTQEQLWAIAARELQHLSGFSRVVIYHFHADGHGEIVAEERSDASAEPYLGLHFPASDIPAQARDVYLTKLSRMIVSTEDLAYPIWPAENPATGEPLDLTRAELRSVSPHHLQFMRNMGQASTLSFSLVSGGELIGMITCSHDSPIRLPYVLRQSLEVFAQQLAAHLGAFATIERLKRVEGRLRARMDLIGQFNLSGSMVTALLGGAVTMLDLVPATGAAINITGTISSLGDAPAADLVQELLARVGSRELLPFACEALASEYPDLAALLPSVAGVLIVPFHGGANHLIWFRPEIVETTTWLGDQSEANRKTPLSPRNSFSAWSSSVSGQAQPWGDFEHQAIQLGRDLDGAIMRATDSELAHLGMHDALTGLPNRRLLMERLQRAVATSIERSAVSLLFIDLDSFKNINDELGHEQGDAVLTQVTARLLSVTRKTDTVARIGGDEFVILCESTDHDGAARMAERVREALRFPLTVNGRSLHVTASIGVAIGREDDLAADLLRRADDSMYQDKRTGRS